MERAFLAARASSSWRTKNRIHSAPASGRKVIVESIGQPVIAGSPQLAQDVPGDQGDDSDQHGKGVVVDVPALQRRGAPRGALRGRGHAVRRSEEHTSELQSLMRISYAVFCLNKKTNPTS